MVNDMAQSAEDATASAGTAAAELEVVCRLVSAMPSPGWVVRGGTGVVHSNAAFTDLVAPVAVQSVSDLVDRFGAAVGTALDVAASGRAETRDVSMDPTRPEAIRTWCFTPIAGADGRVAGVFCAIGDAAARQPEARRAALRQALGDAFVTRDTESDAIHAAAELLAEHLDADIAGVSEADAEGMFFSIRPEWTVPEESRLVGAHRLEDFGPEMVAALRAGRLVHVPDVTAYDQTAPFAAAFAALDFRAFVAAPLLRGGRLVGTTFALSRAPRRWTDADAELVAEVGQRLWAVIDGRRAEARLRESDRQLALALDAACAGTFVLSPDDPAPAVTEGARRLFGFDATDTPPVEAFLERVHAEDRDRVATALQAAMEKGESHYIEYRVTPPDGEVRWLASRAQVEESAEGRRVWGALLDVTDRKAAEAAQARLSASAAEANALLRAVAEEVDDLIYVKDADHRLRFANPALARVVGAKVEDLLGLDDAEWTANREQGARIIANDREVMEADARRSFEEVLDGPSGQRTFLSTKAPLHDEEGRVVGLVGVTKDITDRKRAEEELARERELLRSIFDTIPIMITVYDPSVKVMLVNNAFEQLTGWSDADAAQIDLMAAIYPDPDYRAEIARFMDRCEGWMDVRMTVRDGRTIDTMWANVALSDARRVGIGLDISARKRDERHKQVLIAELDHRVKNTLAVIQAIARQSFQNVDGAERMVGSFQGRLRALASAHDLLTETSWEAADLHALAQASVTATVPRSEAVRYDGPVLRLSPKQSISLAMAFHELATNATKHGALSVEAGRVEVAWAVATNGDGTSRLRLTWREIGGPPVEAPSGNGFGSRLLSQILPRDLRGSSDTVHAADGLVWTLEAPLRPA